MPVTNALQSTTLKEGPLELWDRSTRSWVSRHVEVCLRMPDEPDKRDVSCLAYRVRPARRELGNAGLQSSFLCDAEQPDIGGPAAPSCPRQACTRSSCPQLSVMLCDSRCSMIDDPCVLTAADSNRAGSSCYGRCLPRRWALLLDNL